ncbi:PQQ-binding-like beta-propeller repeat protein [Thermodesulfobacteriota bacterium]
MKTNNCFIIMLIFSLVIPAGALGSIADAPWPMFQRDMYHTGNSLFPGPVLSDAGLAFQEETSASVSSPIIGPDGTVYLGSMDGCVYAVSPDGAMAECLYDTGGQVHSTPVLSGDGILYFGNDNGSLFALSTGGALEWVLEGLGQRITSAPAIGPGDNIIVATDSSDSGAVYSISPAGEINWQYPTGSVTFSYPAVDGAGNVYVGSLDGYLYALSSAGTLRWSYLAEDAITSSPVITQDGLILFTTPDMLCAVDSLGGLEWTFTPHASLFGMTENSGFIAAPAVGLDGSIYLGGILGDFHCLDAGGSEQWSVMVKNPSLRDPMPIQFMSPPVVVSELDLSDTDDPGSSVLDGTRVYGLARDEGPSYRVYEIGGPGEVTSFSLGTFDAFDPDAPGNNRDAAPALGANQTLYVSAGGSLHAISSGADTRELSGTVAGIPDTGGPADVAVNVLRDDGLAWQVYVDDEGNYVVPGLEPGIYLLTPEGAGLRFEPASQEVLVLFGDQGGIDFTAEQAGLYIQRSWADPAEVRNDRASSTQLQVWVQPSMQADEAGVSVDLTEIGGSATQPLDPVAVAPEDVPSEYEGPATVHRYTADIPSGLPIGPKMLPVTATDASGNTDQSAIVVDVTAEYRGSGAATFEVLIDQPWPVLIITYFSSDWSYLLEVFAPGNTGGTPDYSVTTTQTEGTIEVPSPALGTWTIVITPVAPFEGARGAARMLAQGSSGEYNLSASSGGIGVLFGGISDADNGLLIASQSLQVKTATGGNSATQDGFFFMLTPGGATTLTAIDLSGIYAPSAKTVSVMTGSSTEANIMVRQAGQSGACFLDALFASSESLLDTLRDFRDRALRKSVAGRAYVRAYYRHGAEVRDLLEQDPQLGREVRGLVRELLPTVQRALDGEALVLDQPQQDCLRECLEKLKGRGSSNLQKMIETGLRALESNSLTVQLELE